MNRRTLWIPLIILTAGALLTGCSRKVGWGVVLWSFDGSTNQASSEEGAEPGTEPKPEGEAAKVPAGSILPVLIQSNINKVYVVELPDSRGKAEVPIWKVELFHTRKDAESRAQAFAPYAPLYGVALRDGLVLREEPRSTASQVYRLRRDQRVKILERAEGEVVTTGGDPLSGEWYLAMGEDGTKGYLFSNQLRVYDEREGDAPHAESSGTADLNAELEPLFVRSWRPEYFGTMVEDSQIDLERFNPQYGLFVDGVRRQIRVEYPGASRFFNYSTIQREADGSLGFEGLPLTMRFREDGLLDVTIESENGAGTYTFEPFDKDVREIIRREELRRSAVLNTIASNGERFVSEDWGTLTITRTGRFIWIAYDKLIPEALPEYSGDTGAADPALFLGPALEGEWDGGLSLTFDEGRSPRIDFVYKLTPEGLDMQLVRPIDKDWAVVKTLSEPALLLHFRRTTP